MYRHLKGAAADVAVGALFLLVAAFLFQHVRQRGQHDFMPFYLGGELAASGQIARIYDTSTYQPLIAQLRAEGERMSPFDAHYFIRPAFEAFFYVPFTWLSYRHAATVAFIGNVGLLGILVWKLPIWFGVRPTVRWVVRFGLVIFYPFLWSIVLGQDTLLMTLLVGYALSRDVSRRDSVAGVSLGLCAWKPNLTGLLPFALMAAGRWRMALYDLTASWLLLAVSFGLVGVKGFHQWVDLVQAPSSDITPALMGNIRALAIHLGPVAGAIALGAIVVSCYFVACHGSLSDTVSAALLAALLLSPHTYWQDYSLAGVIALLGSSPASRLLLLLPWPYLYSRQDELPMIVISLSYLIFLAVKQAFGPQPDCEIASGVSGTAGV